MAFTLTDRLELPSWSQGSDGPSRVQLNDAFKRINDRAAYDDGAVGGVSLPTSGVVDGRYAQTVDGPYRRLFRRAGGAWQAVGGNTWSETTFHRAEPAAALTGVARQVLHPSLASPTLVEQWDGTAIRSNRQAIGDANGTPAALHVGDTASGVDLANRGRVYVRTTGDGQRGIVASAHGTGAGHLLAVQEPGSTIPWYVDAQGRMRAQAPTAYGSASLVAGTALAAAAPSGGTSAADLSAGSGQWALRAYRALGDTTPIAAIGQNAITLGRTGWTGASIDLTAPTIRLTGAVSVTGNLTIAGGQISSDNLPKNLTLDSLVTGTLQANSTSTLANVTATSMAATGTVSGQTLQASKMLKLAAGIPAAVAGLGTGQVRLGDVWQVEVWDGTAWQPSATFGTRGGAVHAWQQASYTLNNGSEFRVTGWSAVETGSFASLSSGDLTINRAGLWSLRWSSFVDAGVSGYVSAKAETTNGNRLFSGLSWLAKTETRQITVGVPGSGSSEVLLTWTGYVPAAFVGTRIRFVVYQANDAGQSTNSTVASMSAEFLSD